MINLSSGKIVKDVYAYLYEKRLPIDLNLCLQVDIIKPNFIFPFKAIKLQSLTRIPLFPLSSKSVLNVFTVWAVSGTTQFISVILVSVDVGVNVRASYKYPYPGTNLVAFTNTSSIFNIESRNSKQVTMIMKFVIHFIILVIWEVSAQDDLPLVKPDCDWQCGDVPIPFPFGMKSSEFYAGKWFEIECRNTSTYTNHNHNHIHTPYLKSIGLEVTSIYVERGLVNINHLIYPVIAKPKILCWLTSRWKEVLLCIPRNITNLWPQVVILWPSSKLNGSEVSGGVFICDENYKVGDIGKMELRNNDYNEKSY
ncbi:hypothetical protein VNO80_29232 [Phaseolus coccineus]|uniref:Wall-associated receptor kinase galacturonan-binding domain-containing protein n=1 Tax=Phaseolus coccineus TaxID=3886 RepID=A0AAN9QC82_PHACN